MKPRTVGAPAFSALTMVKWVMAVGLLATVSAITASGEPVDGGSADKKRCYRCELTAVQAHVLDCRVCDRPFCEGCAYLMRGDEFCCKVCAFAFIYPDEGRVYLGGKLQGAAPKPSPTPAPGIPSAPPRKTRLEIRRAKMDGLDLKRTRFPDGYPDPYPEPYWPKLPMPGHPIPLEALYQREGERSGQKSRTSPPLTGTASSERLVYQTNHESRVYIYRLRRQSNPRLGMQSLE